MLDGPLFYVGVSDGRRPLTETLSAAPEAPAMRVFRVSHSFVAAASRRHARRRPRRAPARVSAAMDLDPVTNLRVGYRRTEMWSESLVGTVKQHDCHAFLVHGDAVEWPGKEFEPAPGSVDEPSSPAVVMHDALLDASGTYKGGIYKFEEGTNAVGSVKLNLAEAPGAAGGVAGDAVGDVLLFPQMRRHRLGPERVRDKSEIAAFVQSVVVDGDDAESAPLASSAHVFVCTHASRDARCGVCGPALVDAFRAAVAADSELRGRVEVRGCSHVGGHKYAGNVLVFAPRGGVFSGLGQKKKASSVPEDEDAPRSCFGAWYGYVTPREIDEVLRRTVGRGEIIPRLWRGSMGMDPDAHEAAAAAAAAAANGASASRRACNSCASTRNRRHRAAAPRRGRGEAARAQVPRPSTRSLPMACGTSCSPSSGRRAPATCAACSSRPWPWLG